jgi:hypothetical protein
MKGKDRMRLVALVRLYLAECPSVAPRSSPSPLISFTRPNLRFQELNPECL